MSHENAPRGPESKSDKLSPEQAAKHKERLQEHIEKNAEKRAETSSAELEARREVAHEALPAAEYQPDASESASQQDTPAPTRQDKKRGFDTTMHHVRKDLRPTERAFSKVIHQPAIEKVSEVAGKTVTRPSGVIGATAFGLLGLLILFGVAKYIGFELSGSEMPLLLAAGFVAGLLVEWFYKAARSLFARKASTD